MVLSFLKLLQSCSSDEFTFLSLCSQIYIKFVSNSIQIDFNVASEPAFFFSLFLQLLQFISEIFLHLSIYFRFTLKALFMT